MLIQVLIVWLMGAGIIYFGYLIFSMKVPTLLDFLFHNGVTYHDKRIGRFWGSIVMIIGVFVILSPFIFGVEEMNL